MGEKTNSRLAFRGVGKERAETGNSKRTADPIHRFPRGGLRLGSEGASLSPKPLATSKGGGASKPNRFWYSGNARSHKNGGRDFGGLCESVRSTPGDPRPQV